MQPTNIFQAQKQPFFPGQITPRGMVDSTKAQAYNFNNAIGASYLNPSSGSTIPYSPQATSQPSPDLNRLNGGGSGGGASADDLALYDYQIGLVNQGLSRLPNQQNIGLSNILNSFRESQNRLAEQRGQAERDYNTTKTDTGRDFANTRASIRNDAGAQYSALRRILGAAGAGGSTAAKFLAPLATRTQQGSRFGQVQDSFQRNQRNIDTSFQDSERQFDEFGRELVSQRQQKENQLRSGLADQEVSLLDQLGQLRLNRQRAAGGSAQDAINLIQPQTSRIAELLNNIDNFGRLYPTSVAPAGEVTFNTPDLEAYNYSQFDAPQNQSEFGRGLISPLARLFSEREDERA